MFKLHLQDCVIRLGLSIVRYDDVACSIVIIITILYMEYMMEDKHAVFQYARQQSADYTIIWTICLL